MKKISAKYAEKLMNKLGLDYGNDGITFYATNESETEIYDFDDKKERDKWLEKVNNQMEVTK
jgi:hypothetical protein